LVGTDGPYAYITKEDAKNDSHSGRKSGVETDAAFGLSKIRMGGVVSDLWTATSLHRSQILRDLGAMQAQAAEFSGYAGKFRCFLERRL
jgi:hypothetical protein